MKRYLMAAMFLLVFSAFLSLGAQDLVDPETPAKPEKKAEKYDLTPQFEKGMVFGKTTELTIKVAMMNLDIKRTMELKVTVLDTKENKIKKAKIEFIKMTNEGMEAMGDQVKEGMREYGMDEDAMNLDLTGHWIIAKFKKDGTISKIEEKSEKFPEEDSKEFFKEFKIIEEEIPEEKIAVGEGWDLKNLPMPSMGELKASTVFEKIEEEVAYLKYSFETVEGEADEMNPMAQMMKFEGKGTTKIDIIKHRILSSEFSLKYSIEMMGLEIPITAKNTYDYDLKDKPKDEEPDTPKDPEDETPETPSEKPDPGDDF